MKRSLQDNLRQRQQHYIQQAEEKVLSLEVVVPPAANATTAQEEKETGAQPQPHPQAGVRVMGGGNQVIIPTTEEMLELISNPEALQAIRELEQNLLQKSDEKVAIADQTYSLVDAIVKRLDSDLERMEQVLQSTGEFLIPGTAKPDDLAAIQVTAGSTDWILAKVISHDPHTGMYKLSDEDVESSKSKCEYNHSILFLLVWLMFGR